MRFSFSKNLKIILSFLFFAFSLPFLTIAVQKTQKILIKAQATKPANLVVNTNYITGRFPSSWRMLAQGGEESTPHTLKSVLPELTLLSPKYIRIDHIYDFYDVVSRNQDGSLNFSFAKLDILVNDILSVGAKPFFSLSYMPPPLAEDVVGRPYNWEEWQLLVQKTIEHYSGKNEFNLDGLYYEVWNEPDLFGRFQINSGEKDYLTLYAYAAKGAISAQNVNQFYFGGPALTQAYPSWFQTLLIYTQNNHLPLDFLSWHYYGKDFAKLIKDIETLDQIINTYSADRKIQKIISEWGIDSELNPAYDNLLSAAYTLAGIKTISSKVDLLFTFEIKDGQSVSGQSFWGRWGLITHEAFGKNLKPRFHALKMLALLDEKELSVTGEGTFVDAFSTKSQDTIKFLVYNYDPAEAHYEAVPITFQGLEKGIYEVKIQSITSPSPLIQTHTINQGVFSTTLVLTPNEVIFIELKKTAQNFIYTQGRNPNPSDQSLELTQNSELPVFPLTASISSNNLFTLDFWFKPYWSGTDNNISYPLFTLFGSDGQTYFAQFQKSGFSNSLVFGFKIGDDLQSDSLVILPVRDWTVNSWHHLRFLIATNKLALEIDQTTSEKNFPLNPLPINQIKLEPAYGAIDDLIIKVDQNTLLNQNFNL